MSLLANCWYLKLAQTNQVKAGTEMKLCIRNFWNDTTGQDLVEYALAAGMVAVAAVAAMPSLTTVVSGVFTRISSIIANTVN
jgi:pilus assembly protein Flp/PilA